MKEYRLKDEVTYKDLKKLGFEKSWYGTIVLLDDDSNILIEINPLSRRMWHIENEDYLLEMKEYIVEIPEIK